MPRQQSRAVVLWASTSGLLAARVVSNHMVLVTADGYEILTPGLPYTAAEIGRAIRPSSPRSAQARAQLWRKPLGGFPRAD